MGFLDLIKICSDNELENIVRDRIVYLEELYEYELDNIGFQVDYNPSNCVFLDNNNEFGYGVLCIYRGYIPKNTKITYGVINNIASGLVYNGGRYYYLDDDSYIVDFCKFIRNADVLDEYDLFDYTLLFLQRYFGCFERINREDMFKMIYNESGLFLDPVGEHKFSDFKKKGSALCSEYSIAAQNILSVFGFDMYVVLGAQGSERKDYESHAYNLISYTEEETSCEINALIDFSNSVVVMNSKLEKVCRSPFIEYIDHIDSEFLDDLMNNDKHLMFDNYDLILFSNSIMKCTNGEIRDYYIDVTKQKEYVKR